MNQGGIFIGLGANLGDRREMIEHAIRRLDAHPDIDVLKVSGMFHTSPWRVDDQPDYVNAVAEIATRLDPAALLERLLAVERELGRERSTATRWAARTIDLDLLLYRDTIIDSPSCRVPHPHLHEREFALRPLLEIAPGVRIPGVGSASECLTAVAARTPSSVRPQIVA